MATTTRSKMYDDLDRACLGRAEEFFAPEDRTGGRWNPIIAKSLCLKCPHKIECLETALDPRQPMTFGVWGGMDEDQRRGIMRCRRGDCGTTCKHIYRERSTGWQT